MHHRRQDEGEYDARNQAEARRLRGQLAVVFGAGTTGSKVALELARAGMDVRIFDRDVLEKANLHRTEAAARYVGMPKAIALAKTLQDEMPATRKVHGIQADIALLTEREMLTAIDDAAVVVGATASQLVDRRLNVTCRRAGVPLVVPRLWPENGEYVGDVLVAPWPEPNWSHRGCLGCARPEERDQGEALEAQRGLGVEVGRVADLTAQLIVGMLVPATRTHLWYRRCIARGRNYFLVPRVPSGLLAVRTMPRLGCPDCSRDLPQAREQQLWRISRITALTHRPKLEPRPMRSTSPTSTAAAREPTVRPSPAPSRKLRSFVLWCIGATLIAAGAVGPWLVLSRLAGRDAATASASTQAQKKPAATARVVVPGYRPHAVPKGCKTVEVRLYFERDAWDEYLIPVGEYRSGVYLLSNPELRRAMYSGCNRRG